MGYMESKMQDVIEGSIQTYESMEAEIQSLERYKQAAVDAEVALKALRDAVYGHLNGTVGAKELLWQIAGGSGPYCPRCGSLGMDKGLTVFCNRCGAESRSEVLEVHKE